MNLGLNSIDANIDKYQMSTGIIPKGSYVPRRAIRGHFVQLFENLTYGSLKLIEIFISIFVPCNSL